MQRRHLTCLTALTTLTAMTLPLALGGIFLTAPLPVYAETPKADERPLMEMVFVLDTTGSMGGLIEGAKQKIWDIVNEMMKTPADKRPEVRIGLVAYRDNGDDYVTKVLPITKDLDKVYATLMEYQAGGGGDGPENVRRGLSEGVKKAGWTNKSATKRKVAQVIFLVGDAPPHDDYKQEPDTLTTAALAVNKGIFINTILCGGDSTTAAVWQKISRAAEGQYFAIAQDGGVQSIATPYDDQLAKLGGQIGSTQMAYGGGGGTAGVAYRASAGKAAMETEAKVSASTAAAPMKAAAADRAINKALNSYAYQGDLLQSIENGSVKLDAVKKEDLPDNLQKMTPAERKVEVDKRLAERKKMRAQILELSKKRDDYQRKEKARLAKNGKANGFDAAVSLALKKQAAKRGLKL